MIMTPDQLLKALPRDLQWEILSEFVGTHVVRNGKLRRKLRLDTINHQLKYLIRNRPCYGWLYKRNNDELNKRVFARFPSNGRMMMFCRDFNTDETINLYYKWTYIHSVWEFMWKVKFETVVLETLDLPPFIKHEYPSYPYTNKKMSRSVGK
jgi:hypothetical protein